MSSYKGIIALLVVLIISASLWFTAPPLEAIGIYEQLSYVIGGLSITGFALVFILSVRNKTIERLFNGLEKVYLYHKVLAVFSIAMVFLHAQLREFREDRGEQLPFRGEGEFENEGLSHFAGELGEIAQNGFLFLIIIALFAKFLKYEHWRYIHRLMIIPFAVGLFHTYFTGKYDLFQLSPLSIFMAILALAGLASAIYMLGIYQHLQFKYKGKITNIHKLGEHAVELELTLNKTMNYQNGQYIFLKVFQQGLEQAPHPFSISGGDGQKIYITIKALGDFTKKLNETIQLNTAISIDGPYGHMNFEKGNSSQLWVAGGVGITPFLSYLKNTPLEKDVELFYSYRGPEEAMYKEFLEQYAAKNNRLKLNIIDTTVSQRLSFEHYTAQKDTSIFMCGPKKMIKTFNQQLKQNSPETTITFEAFKFK